MSEPLHFNAPLQHPAAPGTEAGWGFVVLPKPVSEALPRRGRTTVECQVQNHQFRVTLEPDGQLSHWLRVPADVVQAIAAKPGEALRIAITPVADEPEPTVPPDLEAALKASPEADHTWKATTTLARVDWVHWVESAKQARTREKRIRDACIQLAEGKRRVCCFDVSGYYSKAFSAPDATDGSPQELPAKVNK